MKKSNGLYMPKTLGSLKDASEFRLSQRSKTIYTVVKKDRKTRSVIFSSVSSERSFSRPSATTVFPIPK